MGSAIPTIDARIATARADGLAPTFVDHVLARVDLESVALFAPHGGDALTYRTLADLVDLRRSELDLAARSIVVLTGDNSLDWVLTYLALIADRHVPVLASSQLDRLVDQWQPAAVVTADRRGWTLDRRPSSPPVELHPDLALLMGTSGSTGSPKLVRLSSANLIANATSIADFQRLGRGDRAVTNLPLSYSMGLSVLNSHLIAGAGVVVTDTSVVDECFARAIVEHGVTNIAGVPHTYELLDQAGPDRIHVPSLRFLAQAGGRMAPARVAAWAARAESWGAEWYSMYGQTEATARMSYVPPELVRDHPGTIGRAIPGGEFTIEPIGAGTGDVGTGDVGEIVYRGPNVMLGYAEEVGDLAVGSEVDELRTGDLGRVDPATGLLEVVGRRSRHVKPFGLRVDLDDVERRLAATGAPARVAGDDHTVVAFPDDEHADDSLVERLREITGLPRSYVTACPGPAPRHPNGKVDYAAMLARARAVQSDPREPAGERRPGHDDPAAALVSIAGEVLGRSDIDPSESFVSLGGDSLSYVECSIRFERVVGALPGDWHTRPLADLAGGRPRRRLARLDTTVLLRSIGILAVVATHMRLWHVPGGAHLMLGVVGYNVARFLLPIDDTGRRMRSGFRTVARVAVPTVLWTLMFMLLAQYTWTTLTLANNYLGPRSHAGNHWHFWFIEVFTHLVVITLLVTAVPIVRRADLRWPYAFPLALLGLTLTLRMGWADMGDWYNLRFRTHAVAWFFVLGWLVQRSSTWPQKAATTVLCLATAPGVFNNPRREYFIALGLVLLVWARDLPFPRVGVRPLATLAAASMWIYISHFMIWPPMKDWFIVEVAYVLTILASLGVWWAMTQAPRHLANRFGRVRIPFRSTAPANVAPTPA